MSKIKIIAGIAMILIGLVLVFVNWVTIIWGILLIILGIFFIALRKDENIIEEREDLNKRKTK